MISVSNISDLFMVDHDCQSILFPNQSEMMQIVVNQKNEPKPALHSDLEKQLLPRQGPPAVTLPAVCAEF